MKTLKKTHPAVVMVATICFSVFMVYQVHFYFFFRLKNIQFLFTSSAASSSFSLESSSPSSSWSSTLPWGSGTPRIRLVFVCSHLIIIQNHWNILGKCCQGSILEENWKRESGRGSWRGRILTNFFLALQLFLGTVRISLRPTFLLSMARKKSDNL